jgi:integrase
MAKGFTDIAIRNLQPGPVRREIPDAGCGGLYLVLQPSGAKSWAVRYRYNGTPRKLTLAGGLTLKTARKLASDALYELEQSRDPAQTKQEARAKIKAAKANTVRALCENYLHREAGKLRSGRLRKQTLERLVYPAIGDLPLADLKRSHVVAMLDDVEDRCGAKMADLTLAFVRKIFNWHAARVDDFNSPITRSMGRYDAKANQGTRVLTDDELRAVWQATKPNDKVPNPFSAFVRFALLTGCRRSEGNKLRWSEVKDGVWTLPPERNKTKVAFARPLSKAAQRVLESMPMIDSGDLVFSHDGRRPNYLTLPTERLKAASGTSAWRLHDLRRTTRTLLSRTGTPPDICELCLGHVLPGAVRQIYDKHTYQGEMQRAFEALASLIERIVHPPKGDVVQLRRRARATP